MTQNNSRMPYTSIFLPPGVEKEIRILMDEWGLTKSEAIRRAIGWAVLLVINAQGKPSVPAPTVKAVKRGPRQTP